MSAIYRLTLLHYFIMCCHWFFIILSLPRLYHNFHYVTQYTHFAYGDSVCLID